MRVRMTCACFISAKAHRRRRVSGAVLTTEAIDQADVTRPTPVSVIRAYRYHGDSSVQSRFDQPQSQLAFFGVLGIKVKQSGLPCMRSADTRRTRHHLCRVLDTRSNPERPRDVGLSADMSSWSTSLVKPHMRRLAPPCSRCKHRGLSMLQRTRRSERAPDRHSSTWGTPRCLLGRPWAAGSFASSQRVPRQ
ncbi:hypothetical protein IE81DRAFT_133048 [Ceraceosorus guamensis]|uniref:Uncharacterized protein n=1 Tax=Ceraceosorus guamensis TaxID=1522189 RepID=A0A316WDU6_9BASI|nr:hypothetical protein IE81DRAFT_133048 [Ceraceosorus guamensis]PWN45983.1 hypothetical protein IE81DRAFT_133048 [Ceraceosorus guamensis]